MAQADGQPRGKKKASPSAKLRGEIGKASNFAGKLFGIGTRSVEKAARIKEASGDLVKEVMHGDISLQDAYEQAQEILKRLRLFQEVGRLDKPSVRISS